MKTYNTIDDIRRKIGDQPIDKSLYVNYDWLVEMVSWDYLELLESKDKDWRYGDKIPEYSDEEFWDLFKPYEKQEFDK